MGELDVLLKNILNDEVNPSEQDIEKNFLKLKKTLVDNKSERYAFHKFSYINFKKATVISICSLLCVTTILISSSSTLRAATHEAFNGIKSIFVVEGSVNDLKIVQKPANEVRSRIAVSDSTSLSDSEIEKLVGYKVILPKNLADNFELVYRYLEVALNNEVPYDSMSLIAKQMKIAILDQEEFTKLSAYSPYRATGGVYKYTMPNKKYGQEFFINSWPVPSGLETYSKKENVKIGDIKGFWIKVKYPVYPDTNENGVTENDMSSQPVIRDDLYVLSWSNNGIYYSLYNFGTKSSFKSNENIVDSIHTSTESYLSKEEAIKIATEFQAAQP